MSQRKLMRSLVVYVVVSAAAIAQAFALGLAAQRAETVSLTGNDFTPDYVAAKAWLEGSEPYAPVDKLIERQRVDSLSILKNRYRMLNPAWIKLRRVDGALHQILSAEDEDPLETPFDSDYRDLRRDVQPG